MNRSFSRLSVWLLAAGMLSLPVMGAEYCWRATNTRGVGTIPSECSFSQEKQGLLCYPKCRAGFSGVGPVCWQNCPAGFRDDGAFCSKPAPYGRGAGYAWHIEDGFSSDGMIRRCESESGGNGTCEMWAAMAYPKCKPGFHALGSNICTPDCPAGMADIGVSCAKETETRPTIAGSCGSGQVYDTGLCYTTCKSGYSGVGPVCWGGCPANLPFPCGAGCAKDRFACGEITTEQVMSAVELVFSIGDLITTGGAVGTVSRAVSKGVQEGSKVAVTATAKVLAGNITEDIVTSSLTAAAATTGTILAKETGKAWGKTLGKAAVKNSAISSGVTLAGGDPPDFNWADLDLTGIAPVVMAYNHATCSVPADTTGAPSPTANIPAPAATTVSADTKYWIPLPGKKATDIGVTGGGTAWIISDEPSSQGGGNNIYRMSPTDSNWIQMPGAAVRIAAAGDNVWALNKAGSIYRWNTSNAKWEQMPGWASDIAVDAVGNAYVIGTNRSVWELETNQHVWGALPAPPKPLPTILPKRIFANGNEEVFISTNSRTVFRWIGGRGEWAQAPDSSAVDDMAVSPDGNVYLANYAVPAGGSITVMNAGTSLPKLPGIEGSLNQVAAIAEGGTGRVWAVRSDGAIYEYMGVK